MFKISKKELPTKQQVIDEAKKIYMEAINSDNEGKRQAATMKMMFICGAFYARNWKNTKS